MIFLIDLTISHPPQLYHHLKTLTGMICHFFAPGTRPSNSRISTDWELARHFKTGFLIIYSQTIAARTFTFTFQIRTFLENELCGKPSIIRCGCIRRLLSKQWVLKTKNLQNIYIMKRDEHQNLIEIRLINAPPTSVSINLLRNMTYTS